MDAYAADVKTNCRALAPTVDALRADGGLSMEDVGVLDRRIGQLRGTPAGRAECRSKPMRPLEMIVRDGLGHPG